MRPGRARPGCGALPIPSQTSYAAAFNEAGARAPRMPAIRTTDTHGLDSFNEAGARAPRMPWKKFRSPYKWNPLQ